MAKYIDRFILEQFIGFGYYIGKIIDLHKNKFTVIFTDGEILYYSLREIIPILINLDNFQINNKQDCLTQCEKSQLFNTAFLLCSFKYI